MTHICVAKQTIIGSDIGLSPGLRQAIIWTNAGVFLIGPLGTNFSEISIKIIAFSFTKMRLKVSSTKWRPFCLGLNVLRHWYTTWHTWWQLQRLWEFKCTRLVYFTNWRFTVIYFNILMNNNYVISCNSWQCLLTVVTLAFVLFDEMRAAGDNRK